MIAEKAGKPEAIEVIVETMKNNMDNAGICRAGCLILALFTTNSK